MPAACGDGTSKRPMHLMRFADDSAAAVALAFAGTIGQIGTRRLFALVVPVDCFNAYVCVLPPPGSDNVQC